MGALAGLLCRRANPADALNLCQELLKNNKYISKNIETRVKSGTYILLFFDIFSIVRSVA